MKAVWKIWEWSLNAQGEGFCGQHRGMVAALLLRCGCLIVSGAVKSGDLDDHRRRRGGVLEGFGGWMQFEAVVLKPCCLEMIQEVRPN